MTQIYGTPPLSTQRRRRERNSDDGRDRVQKPSNVQNPLHAIFITLNYCSDYFINGFVSVIVIILNILIVGHFFGRVCPLGGIIILLLSYLSYYIMMMIILISNPNVSCLSYHIIFIFIFIDILVIMIIILNIFIITDFLTDLNPQGPPDQCVPL